MHWGPMVRSLLRRDDTKTLSLRLPRRHVGYAVALDISYQWEGDLDD